MSDEMLLGYFLGQIIMSFLLPLAVLYRWARNPAAKGARACLFFIPVGFIALQWMTMQPAILMIGHLVSLACAGFFLATHRK